MHFERQLRAPAGESALGGADDLLRASAAVEVIRLAVRRRGQKMARRHVPGEDVQPLIEKKEALAHVFRDRGKVAPRLSERLLLLADKAVLRADAREQRHKLFIRRFRAGALRVDPPDGVNDAARCGPSARCGERERDRKHPQQMRERLCSCLRPGKLGLHGGVCHSGAEENGRKEQQPHAKKEFSLHGSLRFSGENR